MAIVWIVFGIFGIFHVACFKASYLKMRNFSVGDPCSLIGAS